MTTLDDILYNRIATPIHEPYDTVKHSIQARRRAPKITPLLWGRDYFVRTIRLPDHIGGVSTANPDGTYNIYLNERLSIEVQWQAFAHELLHCEAGHLDEWAELPIEVKEWEADHLRPIVRGIVC